MSYRMSYRLSTGPPKAKDDLAVNEGLTDHLVVVSVVGTPGQPEAMSMAPLLLGPDGLEPFNGAMVFAVAVMLLAVIERTNDFVAPRLKVAAGEALECLRRPILEGRNR